MKVLDVINKCIEDTKNMSREEFNQGHLNIKNKTYDIDKYMDDEFKIIIPSPEEQ